MLEFNTRGREKDPEILVILFHGYGANGDDLLNLAEYWARDHVPSAKILCPSAPHLLYGTEPRMRSLQWFDLGDYSPEVMAGELQECSLIVEQFIRTQLEKNRLPYDKLILSGFSQGAMLSLYLGLFGLPQQPLGVLSYSGAYFMGAAKHRPRVLLVHGDADEVVSVEACHRADRILKDNSVPSRVIVEPGVGHCITNRGRDLGGKFLREVLSL